MEVNGIGSTQGIILTRRKASAYSFFIEESNNSSNCFADGQLGRSGQHMVPSPNTATTVLDRIIYDFEPTMVRSDATCLTVVASMVFRW
jgi:hypothetical protein